VISRSTRLVLALWFFAAGAASPPPGAAQSGGAPERLRPAAHRPVEGRQELVTAVEEISSATVVAVSDGDTVTARENGLQLILHLDGVDAPELKQRFGSEAQAYLSELVANRMVTVRVRSRAPHGGESLARLEVAGADVSAMILQRGFARYCSRFADDPQLRRAEAEARKAGRGLWADPNAPAPWVYRGVRECWQEK
jgi:endonuclease YncB( thermonuclease family)